MKASDYRATARQTLSGNWKPAVIAALVYIAIGAFMSCITSVLTNSNHEGYQWLSSVNSLYSIFITLPLGFACIIAFYNFAKDNSDNRITANLFTLFKANYRKGLLGMLLMTIIIVLIIIIPMIIAAVIAILPFISDIETIKLFLDGNSANPIGFGSILIFVKFILLLISLMLLAYIPAMVYAYRVTLFPLLLVENPEMGIRESFKRSAEIMRGHKWQLFCLDISFIGWFILGLLCAGIGLLWVIPYQQTARSHFYLEMLKGNEISEETSPVNTL